MRPDDPEFADKYAALESATTALNNETKIIDGILVEHFNMLRDTSLYVSVTMDKPFCYRESANARYLAWYEHRGAWQLGTARQRATMTEYTDLLQEEFCVRAAAVRHLPGFIDLIVEKVEEAHRLLCAELEKCNVGD